MSRWQNPTGVRLFNFLVKIVNFLNFFFSQFPKETWVQRKQHQIGKFVLKASEPCQNISNVDYSFVPMCANFAIRFVSSCFLAWLRQNTVPLRAVTWGLKSKKRAQFPWFDLDLSLPSQPCTWYSSRCLKISTKWSFFRTRKLFTRQLVFFRFFLYRISLKILNHSCCNEIAQMT